MSVVLASGHQIGLHSNTLNNFTWYQPNTPNGSIVFGQGDYGNVTTQLTISNSAFTFSTNTTFSGIAIFSANTTLNGITTFGANTSFNGIATFGANTTLNGIATFGANAGFSGIATFNANTTFNGISTFSANTTFSANVVLSGGLVANGSVGSNGQVLTSNGSTSYWATSSAATTGKAIAMAIVFGG